MKNIYKSLFIILIINSLSVHAYNIACVNQQESPQGPFFPWVNLDEVTLKQENSGPSRFDRDSMRITFIKHQVTNPFRNPGQFTKVARIFKTEFSIEAPFDKVQIDIRNEACNKSIAKEDIGLINCSIYGTKEGHEPLYRARIRFFKDNVLEETKWHWVGINSSIESSRSISGGKDPVTRSYDKNTNLFIQFAKDHTNSFTGRSGIINTQHLKMNFSRCSNKEES